MKPVKAGLSSLTEPLKAVAERPVHAMQRVAGLCAWCVQGRSCGVCMTGTGRDGTMAADGAAVDALRSVSVVYPDRQIPGYLVINARLDSCICISHKVKPTIW